MTKTIKVIIKADKNAPETVKTLFENHFGTISNGCRIEIEEVYKGHYELSIWKDNLMICIISGEVMQPIIRDLMVANIA